MGILTNTIEYLLFQRDKLAKRPNVINGFIESAPTETDYIHSELGSSVEKKILKPDCNWKPFRPVGEQQNEGFEKMWCVPESACNTIEQIVNFFIHLVNNEQAEEYQQEIVKIFDNLGFIENDKCLIDTNYIAIVSETTRSGNTQQRVGNAIRHYGLLPKGTVPIGKTWNKNYKTGDTSIGINKIDKKYIEQGQKLLDYIEFNYEWVYPSQFNDVKKYAPIQTSVYAWGSQKNGIYQRTELPRNHAVDNDYFVYNEYDGIFDSYNPFDKKVAWNFNLGAGMLYTIHLKQEIYNKKKLKYYIDERKTKYLMRVEKNGEIYKLDYEKLEYLDNNNFLTDRAKKAFKNGEMLPISEKDFNELIN